jgi:hypothetical protein
MPNDDEMRTDVERAWERSEARRRREHTAINGRESRGAKDTGLRVPSLCPTLTDLALGQERETRQRYLDRLRRAAMLIAHRDDALGNDALRLFLHAYEDGWCVAQIGGTIGACDRTVVQHLRRISRTVEKQLLRELHVLMDGKPHDEDGALQPPGRDEARNRESAARVNVLSTNRFKRIATALALYLGEESEA